MATAAATKQADGACIGGAVFRRRRRKGKKGNYIDEGAKKLSMSGAMGREDGWVDRAWFLLPVISLILPHSSLDLCS